MLAGGVKIVHVIENFSEADQVILIGGGDIMLFAAQKFIERGFSITVVLAHRHSEENLPIAKIRAFDAFRELNLPTIVLNEISDWKTNSILKNYKPRCFALCFGPAWIFPKPFLESFELGMVNFNGIPIPKFLGGAHYSWQILNNDKSGGCIIQEITEKIDRGAILCSYYFTHSPSVRVPQDYFESNYHEGCLFIQKFIEEIKQNKPLRRQEFSTFESKRVYFPRLFSKKNGWINWSWEAHEIERFCCAFDTPYPGAAAIYGGDEIRLTKVYLEEELGNGFHSFCAGLILRNWEGKVWIGAKSGVLRVEQISSPEGTDLTSNMLEGQRIFTPDDKINNALNFNPTFSGVGIKL